MVKQRKNAKNKRTKRSAASHVKASLTYIAHHRHTGKRLAHRHTSHGALFLILLLAGITLLFSLATLKAAGLTSSADVNVTLTVPGAPPTVGAVITSPPDNSVVTQSLLEVSGTCPVDTTVAIYDNGSPVGSTVCAGDDTFLVTITLAVGINTLQAQNYDGLDQPGPVTGQIQVEFVPEVTPPPPVVNEPDDITNGPALPNTPAAQPSKNPCKNPKLPTSKRLVLTVACITQAVFVGERLEFLAFITGGTAPYALSVDWGDGDTELYSLTSATSQALAHTYLVPQIKTIELRVVDAKGRVYQTQIGVKVLAVNSVFGNSNPIQSFLSNAAAIWIDASVPVYWAAVSLFLGFWVGDIFQRIFGLKKLIRRRRA